MGERFNGMVSKNVPLISYVTRRMVTGHKNELTNRIAAELGVKLTAKQSGHALMSIKGDPAKIEVVESLILALDQKAQIIVDRNGLKTTGDVRREHWNHLRVDLDALLAQAQDALARGTSVTPDFMASALPVAKGPVNDNPIPTEALLSTAVATPVFDEASKGKAASPPAPKIKKRVAFKNNAEFQPLNVSQALTYIAALDNVLAAEDGKRSKEFVNSYVYAGGPAGGGKTYTALKAAADAYQQGMVDEIIIIRPPTTAGKDPGAMPGDKKKKSEPYLTGGIASNLEKITGLTMGELEQKKVVRGILPDWERGETYGTKESPVFVIIDEPQNLTVQQAELLVTRLGEGSIMLWCGDIGGKQNDLKNQVPGLAHLIATQGAGKMNDAVLNRASAFIRFTEEDSAARNKILPHVLKALSSPPDAYASLMQTFQEAGQNPRLTASIEGIRLYAVDILEKTSIMTSKHYEKKIKREFPFLFGLVLEGTVVGANVTVLRPEGRHI